MKDFQNPSDREILFSRAIKAGKRIYYVDVKQSSKGDLFLAITESKRTVVGTEGDIPQFNYEKHKIFLYPEDFDKFTAGLTDAIQYIEDKQGPVEPRPEQPRTDIQLNSDDVNMDDLQF